MIKLKHLYAILLGALITFGTAGEASCEGRSSSGTADISASVPDFIVLHFYSSLNLNFAAPSSEALDQGGNTLNVSWQGETSGGNQLAAGNLMGEKMQLDGTNTTVRVPNVWAVRGFSQTGTASVAVTVPKGKETLSLGESKIVISNVLVSDNSKTAGTITTNLNGITRSKATIGSILMDLNFDQTNRSGLHSGAQYTITASTL